MAGVDLVQWVLRHFDEADKEASADWYYRDMLTSTIPQQWRLVMSSTPATILPDPRHLRLLGLVGDDRGIVATVAAIAPTSVCPQCGHPSRRIHSHYVRRVADLPWHGVAFRLELHVRRFFCDHLECSQRIFTERLPGTVAPSARNTLRLARVCSKRSP